MTETQAILAYLVAAILALVAPGLDTALVLRTAVGEGRVAGLQATCGIAFGCLCWSIAVACGLGALIAVSPLAFAVLKWGGAAYLLWIGINLLLRPRSSFSLPEEGSSELRNRNRFWAGLAQNLLNPKACVFFLSFLPQFVPTGVNPTAFMMMLGCIDAMLAIAWFSTLTLATDRAARVLRKPAIVRRLDRLTGCVFVGFGLKLALMRR